MSGSAPGSICEVLPSAAALLGAPGAVDTLALTDGIDADRTDRVLVVLVDGMGWHLLPQLAASAPLLAAVLVVIGLMVVHNGIHGLE